MREETANGKGLVSDPREQTGIAGFLNRIRHGAFDLAYERFAGGYDAVVRALGYSGHTMVVEALHDALTDGPATLLDAGCGTGLGGKALAQLRPDATIDGFDLAQDMLTRAGKTGVYRTLVSADATKPLPLPKDTYDAAFSSGLYTLGHVGPEALAPVLATIKPGGLFVLNVYEPAWIKLDFEAALRAMEDAGAIAIQTMETRKHFQRLVGESCRLLVLRKGEGQAAEAA